NVLLGSLRVLANFVTLCNAQCCVIPNKNTPGGLSNGKSCARKSSTRRSAAIRWWNRMIQRGPVLS
uniref:Uncharacterized protein n=1 Tax=Panthera tigris altaica TaxID=74533 RepID=A0A8C9KPY3_PANTA